MPDSINDPMNHYKVNLPLAKAEKEKVDKINDRKIAVKLFLKILIIVPPYIIGKIISFLQ